MPHLLSIPLDSYWASVCIATLPDIPSLICDFCSSDQRFAIRLPSDSTSRWTLPLAVSFPLSGHFTNFHRLDYAHAGRTKKDCRRIINLAAVHIYFLNTKILPKMRCQLFRKNVQNERRQYRTKIVPQMRRQLFGQIVQNERS